MKKARLAAKIERRMNKLGMNRTQFAKFMGTQSSVITYWLSGEHNFTLDTIAKIEKRLKIDLIKI